MSVRIGRFGLELVRKTGTLSYCLSHGEGLSAFLSILLSLAVGGNIVKWSVVSVVHCIKLLPEPYVLIVYLL
jgi:hypothetical protein